MAEVFYEMAEYSNSLNVDTIPVKKMLLGSTSCYDMKVFHVIRNGYVFRYDDDKVWYISSQHKAKRFMLVPK